MTYLRMGIMTMLFFTLVYNAARWRGKLSSEISCEGHGYRAAVRRGGRSKNVQRITIAMELPGSLRFILRRERGFDRFAKAIGVATEWQSGDAEFDEDIFVVCDDSRLLRALGSDAELRTLCSRLVMRAAGASIECKSGMLYLDVNPGPDFRDDTDDAVIQKILAPVAGMLARLRDRLQKFANDHWNVERDPAFTRKAWLVGTCLVLGVLGTVVVFIDIQGDRSQVVRAAIPSLANRLTACVILGLVFAVFAWLGRTPHTHSVLLDVFLMALPGCWITASAALTWANESLDRSAPQLAPVEVVDTFVRSRRGKTYHLVARWPDSRGSGDMQITAEQYGWVKRGACVLVEWHRGRFGDGWISGYRSCPDASQVER